MEILYFYFFSFFNYLNCSELGEGEKYPQPRFQHSQEDTAPEESSGKLVGGLKSFKKITSRIFDQRQSTGTLLSARDLPQRERR